MSQPARSLGPTAAVWWAGSVKEDNSELLAAAARGDQAAWDLLVEGHAGLLWSIARGYRLNTADAADAVQNTWLRLVEHLDRIAEPERLAGWLATTARRECLHVLRRAGRNMPGGGTELLEQLPDGAPSLDADLLLDERDAALWRALATLSDRCRRLLRVLMASPPPSYTEVAAALDMRIGSIGPTRQRCLDRLRQVAGKDAVLSGAEES